MSTTSPPYVVATFQPNGTLRPLLMTMGPSTSDIDDNEEIKKMQTLAVIYIVTSVLSILGAGSIVIIIIIKRRVTSSELRPIFHLSLADLVASVCLLVGAILYNYRYKTVVKGQVLCSYFTAITSSLYVSTFLLTVVYAVEVYLKMLSLYPKIRNARPNSTRNRRSHEEIFGRFSSLYLMYSFSWALPLAVTFCLFGIDSGEKGGGSLNDDICATCLPVFHYKSYNCSVSESKVESSEPDWNDIYKYMFLGALFITMLAVVVIYILALRLFHRLQKSGGIIGRHQYEQEAQVRRRTYIYQLVFVTCWLPSFILGILSLRNNFPIKKYYALYIIQATVSPLQGFFNCIIYGWRRQGFMRSLRSRSSIPDS